MVTTVTIGVNSFDVYLDEVAASVYLAADLRLDPIWQAAEVEQQKQALVTATRILDQENWQGLPTDLITPQPLAWPRSGVVDKNGTTVQDTVVPAGVENGSVVLAASIIENPSLGTSQSTASNIKGVKAGPAGVTFFRPVQGASFPENVLDLFKEFLGAAASNAAGLASGTDRCSQTPNSADFGTEYNRNRGFA